jgi:hypothetical protein
MTLLTLTLLPWKKVSSTDEARRLTDVGAVMPAILALAPLGGWWLQSDTRLLTSAVVDLELAATIYLGYRTSAVALAAFASIYTLVAIFEVFEYRSLGWDVLPYIGGYDMLTSIAYWLSAAAAIRGTFGLAASERPGAVRAGPTPSYNLAATNNAVVATVVRQPEPAAGLTTPVGGWLDDELENAMLRLMNYPPNAQVRTEVDRSPVKAASLHEAAFSGRDFALKVASVLIVLVGIGVGLAIISLVVHFCGGIHHRSQLARHEYPDIDQILKEISSPLVKIVLCVAFGFWGLIFWLGFMPFLQLARKLWAQAEALMKFADREQKNGD